MADGMSWLEGAVKSAGWGLGPGLIGVRPTGELAEWQQENPWSAGISEAVGSAPAYIGWGAVASRIKPIAQAIQSIRTPQALAQTPFRTGMATEVVRFAPMEAGLIAGNFFAGDTVADLTGGYNAGLGNQVATSALGLGFGVAVAGAIPKLGSIYTEQIATRGILPGANLTDPAQAQMRDVLRNLYSGNVQPDMVGQAEAGLNRLKSHIIRAEPRAGGYVNSSDEGLNKYMNELFAPPGLGSGIISSKLDSGRIAGLQDTIKNVMPNNWEAYAEFPRILQAKTFSMEQTTNKALEEMTAKVQGLRNGSDGVRWDFIPGEDRFVMARKLDNNSWMIWKTDKPEVFLPREEYLASGMNKLNASIYGREPPNVRSQQGYVSGSSVLDFGLALDRELPTIDTRGLTTEAGESLSNRLVREGTAKLENSSVSWGGVRYETGAAVKGLGQLKRQAGAFIKDYLSPSAFQFTQNPVALRIFRITDKMLDHGNYLAQKAIMGNPVRGKTKAANYRDSIIGSRFQGNGSVADKIQKLADTDIAGYNSLIKTIQSEGGIQWGLRNGLTKQGVEILQELEKIDRDLASSVVAAQRAAGMDESELFQMRENHFMLSRTWQGNYRTPVYSGNKLVYVAGGHTMAESARIAREVAEESGWRIGDTTSTTAHRDMEFLQRLADRDIDYLRASQRAAEKAKAPKASDPWEMQGRKGVQGYQTEYLPNDFIKALVNHTSRFRQYEAELGFESMFREDMKKLAESAVESDRRMAERLQSRLASAFGVRGEIDLAINKALDKTPLGTLLGGDSASQIVSGLSKYTFAIALGFTNMTYAIATLGTFIQTAFPAMSFINTLARQAPDRLAKYVSYQPVMSQRGATVMGVIDPMRVANQAWREIGTPDEVLWNNLNRAAAEGKTDPRFIEEYVGQTSTGFKRVKDALKSGNAVGEILHFLGTTLPSSAERFSRTHTFAMGHIFYRDIMNVTDKELLYKLASEFTDLAQFQYGRSHKPQMFQGPAGQMLGLFKTFISNYIGWMGIYAGEAFKHNNFAPMAWQMGGTAALAGVGGLPLFQAANGIYKSFSGDDAGIAEVLWENMGGDGAEGSHFWSSIIYNGLPAALGFTLQGTMQAPFADPVEDALRLVSSAQLDQALRMGRGLGAAFDIVSNPGIVQDPQSYRALANGFLPRSMVKQIQAMGGQDLRSMNTGNVLMRNVTPLERMLLGMGLQPDEIGMSMAIFRDRLKTQDERKGYMQAKARQLTDAILNRDPVAIRGIVIESHINGVPMNTLANSVRTRVKSSRDDIFQQNLDLINQARMQQLGILR